MAVDTLKKEFIDTQVRTFLQETPHGLGFLHRHQVVFDLIARYAQKNARIVDIGCQEGKMLKELAARGYTDLHGIDIQEWSHESLTKSGIDYRVCDIEHEPLPFRKGSIDLIIMTDVLEHLFSPQTVLYDLKPYLSPTGKIIFSTPNAGWFVNGWLLTFFPNKLFLSTAFGPWGHTHQFTFYEVHKMARLLKYRRLYSGGSKLDNYAFRSGLKKLIFDLFIFLTAPLTTWYPHIFSAHMYGVWANTSAKPPAQVRFDVGVSV